MSFTKIKWTEFERLNTGSSEYFETEIDGHRVAVATKDGDCIAVYYYKQGFGTQNLNFKGNELEYSIADDFWPYGD